MKKTNSKMKKLGAALLSGAIMLTSVVLPLMTCAINVEASDAKVIDLRVNDLVAPVGIDTPNPIFSWKMDSDEIGAAQTEYKIVVKAQGGNTAWDSGWVKSGNSVAIRYNGKALASQTKYEVSVTIKDQNGGVTEAATTTFVTAFFEENAFDDTKWISYQDSTMASLTKYTIDFDFKITEAAQGFCFGMNDTRSKFVLWQVSAIESSYTGGTRILLRPHVMDGGWKAVPGSPACNKVVDVTDAIGYNNKEVIGKWVHERIVVDGLTVKTYFGKDANNLTLAATHTYTADFAELLKLGMPGFRHNLIGPLESACYDNIVVKDGSGVTVYEEDFQKEAPALSGEIHYSVTDGVISVGSGNEGKNDATLVFVKKGSNANSLPVFRKEINVKANLKSAFIYSSGLGVYEQYINGVRVGNKNSDGSVSYDELKPGYTEGVKRRMYNTYDVTWMLNEGASNAISAISSPSWWNANDGYLKQGDVSAYFAKLVLTYEDGSVEVINTDTSWKTSKVAPVLMGTTIYAGEKYDATVDTSWMFPGYNDSTWGNPVLNTEFKGVLTAQVGTTVAVREDLVRIPVGYSVYEGIIAGSNSDGFYGKVNTVATYDGSSDITLNPGQTMIVDFGQNFAGWEEFTVTTERGTVITIDHAEMLNDNNGDKSRGNDGPEGSIYDEAYRGAAAITSYTAAGKARETYHPTFTFYGFRYAEVTVSAPTTFHSIRGQVVTSVHEDTASMTTSDADVNQLISNVRWSMYSNYLGIPTDCPQRSERFGWTGDTQVFAHTGLILGNNKSFLHKFTYDLQDGQMTDPSNDKYGGYPAIAPGSHHLNCYGDLGWGDCGIILPYYLYVMSGDVTVIETNWDAMRLYMDEYLADRRYGGEGTFGDWLSYETNSTIGKQIIGTAYHAIDALMMADMAKAIGDTEAEALYKQTYIEKKNIFQSTFVRNDGTLVDGTQAACLYALYADLVDDPKPVIDQLITNIERNGNKLQTGFLGTAIIMPTLTKIGRNDVAYKLLLQHDNPSWLYSVDQGATTIWERWNSYTKAEGFGDADMNSFNHYSYGAVVGWMYSDMAGIDYDTANPGFKHIILSPAPDRLLPVVKASFETPYGTVVSNMEYTDDGKTWTYSATVPANTTATINVPVEDMTKLTVNGKPSGDLHLATDGLEYVKYEDGIVTFNAVAGSFNFVTSVTPRSEVKIVLGDIPANMPPIVADVKVNGTTVANGLPASFSVVDGDVITVTANSMNDVDYDVKSWVCNGAVLSSTNELTYVADGNSVITVNFVDNTLESIAKGKNVTAPQVNSDWSAAYLVDGKNNYLGGTNGWSNPGTAGTSGFSEVTAVIDLGKTMSFDLIHIYPRNDTLSVGVMNCPTAYTIYVSNDNSTWTPVYSTSNGKVTNGFAPIVIELSETARGRYVKLGVTAINRGDEWGNCYVQLSELALYCTEHTFENGACTNCGAAEPIEGDGTIRNVYNVTDAFEGGSSPFKFAVAPWGGSTVFLDTVNNTTDRDGKGYSVTEYTKAGHDNAYVSLITAANDGKAGQLLVSCAERTDTQIIFTAPAAGEYTVNFVANRMMTAVITPTSGVTGCRFYVQYGDTVLEMTRENQTEVEFSFTATLNAGDTIVFGMDPVANTNGLWGHHAADTSYISKLVITSEKACDHAAGYLEWIADEDGHSRFCHNCNTTVVPEAAHSYNSNGKCTVCGYSCTHPNNGKHEDAVYNVNEGFGTSSYKYWSFGLKPWDGSAFIPFVDYVEGSDAASVGYKTINYINDSFRDVKFSMITEEKNGYAPGTLMFNAVAQRDSWIVFTAPEAGNYVLDATVLRECDAIHPSFELTGSRFYVMVDGTVIAEKTISMRGERAEFKVELELAKGQQVVFAMDPVANSVNDWAMAGADDCYITNLTMTRVAEHDIPTGELNWTKTETKHSAKYICCGAVAVPETDHVWVNGVCADCGYTCAHKGGNATCTEKATCELCGQKYGDFGGHTDVNGTWTKDENGHSFNRTCCDTTDVATEAHDYENGVCTECGYECAHKGGEATCKTQATCTVCGQKYGNLNANNHEDVNGTWTSDKNGHSFNRTCCDATDIATEDHTYENGVCTECGYECAHKGGEATCKTQATCTECGQKYGSLDASNHEDVLGTWTKDENGHSFNRTCCDATDVATEAHDYEDGVCTECGYGCNHHGGEATCKTQATCDDCGLKYGELNANNHEDVNGTWTSDKNGHSFNRTCCDATDVATEGHTFGGDHVCDECNYTCTHEGGEATCKTQATCTVCGQKYGSLDASNHEDVNGTWTKDENGHSFNRTCCDATDIATEGHENGNDNVCDECGYGCNHHGGEATCKTQATCDDCGQKYGELDPANHEDVNGAWTSDKNGHSFNRTCCDATDVATEGHTFGGDHICDECNYTCTHEGGEATCDEKATCTVCGQKYGSFAEHDFKDGKCTACGASDPDYVAPDTSDRIFGLSTLLAAIAALGVALIGKKRTAR